MAIVDQHIHIREASIAADATRLSFDAIPVVDIGPLFGSDPDAISEVARQIHEACRRVGFFYITHHGVDPGLIEAAQAAMEGFFALPLAEKMKVYLKQSPNHRGYLPMQELASGRSLRQDLHEGYEVGEEHSAQDPDFLAGNRLFGPNRWPQDPPEFKTALYAYFEAIIRLSKVLYRGVALSLNLPPTFFEDKLNKPLHRLRVISYPPATGPFDPNVLGTNAHTDFEIFTILWQDTVSGLQVLNPKNEWIEATPIEGTFVINVGDLLARWTNDLYLSTVHRVINNRSGKTRRSLALFCGPDADTVVECLASCQDPDHPPKYEPVTAGEWTIKRVNSVYQYDA